jgi:hypothetical protein
MLIPGRCGTAQPVVLVPYRAGMTTTLTGSAHRTFDDRVRLLAQFASAAGTLPRRPGPGVPDAEGDLGRIVNRLRDSYRLGKLTDAQVAAVESVPGWEWRAKNRVNVEVMKDPKWFAKASKVREYADKHGSVPIKHNRSLDERRLTEWCRTQRARRTDLRHPLTDAQKTYLEAIPGWFWDREGTGAQWRGRYQELVAYVDENGRFPNRHGGIQRADRREISLADWVLTQKNKHTNKLLPPHTPAQIALLERIPGWSWPATADKWSARLDDLLAFIREYSKMPSLRASSVNERKLAAWVELQLQDYRSGAMEYRYSDRIDALEQVPGWRWEADKLDDWLSTYAAVFAYAIEHGKLPSMRAHDPEIRKLGTWCGHIRRARTPGKTFMTMSPGREAALELIPGWYWKD